MMNASSSNVAVPWWADGEETHVQGAGSGSIVERVMGVVRLNVPTYEEIEHDNSATTQAAIVVGVVALAGAIGALGIDEGNAAVRFIYGIISAFIGWILFSYVAYFVGTRLIPGENTSADAGQLLRTLGFAQAPSVLGIFGILGAVGGIFSFVGSIWALVCAVIALRQALEMSTGRAIGVAILSVIAVIIVTLPFAIILGIGAAVAA